MCAFESRVLSLPHDPALPMAFAVPDESDKLHPEWDDNLARSNPLIPSSEGK